MSRLGGIFIEYMNVEAVSRLERVFLKYWECRGWVSRLGGVITEFDNVEAVSSWKGFFSNFRNVGAGCRGWEGLLLNLTM